MINFGGVMHQNWRLAPWLVILIYLTIAITALGRRGRIFADYQTVRMQYGDKSREVTALTMKIMARIFLIAACLIGMYVLLGKH